MHWVQCLANAPSCLRAEASADWLRQSVLLERAFAAWCSRKAAVLGEVGAGIQLGPNAFHVFDYLGVGLRATRGQRAYAQWAQAMLESATHQAVTP